MQIETASVRVMRSFDYCHFEVVLTTSAAKFMDGQTIGLTMQQVDDLRKDAARLADKAVAQYKVAKAEYSRRESEGYERAETVRRIEAIRAMTEGDRTVNQQAELKAFDDAAYHARRNYDYEDDWNED